MQIIVIRYTFIALGHRYNVDIIELFPGHPIESHPFPM